MAPLNLKRRDLTRIVSVFAFFAILSGYAAAKRMITGESASGRITFLEHFFSNQTISLILAAFAVILLGIAVLAFFENRLAYNYVISKDELRSVMVAKQIAHTWDDIEVAVESRGAVGKRLTFKLTNGQPFISLPIDRLSASRAEVLDHIRAARPDLPLSLLPEKA